MTGVCHDNQLFSIDSYKLFCWHPQPGLEP
jgi:hypothetical protein